MDERDKRIPIYSYPAQYQRAFALISLGLTIVGIGGFVQKRRTAQNVAIPHKK